MALTYNAYYKYELEKLLNAEIERIKDYLTTAYLIDGFDYAAYRHQVGKIEGLRMALELCEEAESISNGKE